MLEDDRLNSIIICHSPTASFLCETLKLTLPVFQIPFFNNNDKSNWNIYTDFQVKNSYPFKTL